MNNSSRLAHRDVQRLAKWGFQSFISMQSIGRRRWPLFWKHVTSCLSGADLHVTKLSPMGWFGRKNGGMLLDVKTGLLISIPHSSNGQSLKEFERIKHCKIRFIILEQFQWLQWFRTWQVHHTPFPKSEPASRFKTRNLHAALAFRTTILFKTQAPLDRLKILLFSLSCCPCS